MDSLFIDEAGDEGIERVRPVDADGASEYFVMCGVLIRAHRHNEMAAFLNSTKAKIGMAPDWELHFRDLGSEEQRSYTARVGQVSVWDCRLWLRIRGICGSTRLRIERKEI
jgi:hypothetical protein